MYFETIIISIHGIIFIYEPIEDFTGLFFYEQYLRIIIFSLVVIAVVITIILLALPVINFQSNGNEYSNS